MKSGKLNFLEPSGPLQVGNGADCFTFYVHLNITVEKGVAPVVEVALFNSYVFRVDY
jgi:hypothetical protein